ncbi:MAG TPA: hypothetical protein VJT13_05555, partial [Xanthobacteraceae bacterium]|nr:hypothetical protein [Xanthobacteraceae bacterium]
MADAGTFSFTAGTPDNIPAGPGTLPIPITVSGLAGPMTAITVRLDHVTAPDFTDLRFLLVAPDGTHNLVFLADVPNGSGYSLTDQTIYVTDYAGTEVSLAFPVVAPLDREFTATSAEFFPLGVPPGFTLVHAAPEGAATFASAFNGIDPNGTWQLIVLDEFAGGGPSTLLGASLHVVTNVASTITVPTGLSVESGGSIQFLDSSGNIPTGGDPDADFGDFGNFRATVEHGTLGNTENGIFVHFAPAKTIGVGMGIVGGVHAFFDHATYRPDPGFTGVDHITIEVTDQGDFGLGAEIGSLTTTATFAIEVFDHQAGTGGDDSFTASGYQKIDGGAGKDTIKFDFALTQAIVTYSDNTVTIEGPGGTKTVLTGFEKFVFNDGTVDNADGSPLVDDLFYYTRNH